VTTTCAEHKYTDPGSCVFCELESAYEAAIRARAEIGDLKAELRMAREAASTEHIPILAKIAMKMTSALTWYADKETYEGHAAGHEWVAPIENDKGDRARGALQGVAVDEAELRERNEQFAKLTKERDDANKRAAEMHRRAQANDGATERLTILQSKIPGIIEKERKDVRDKHIQWTRRTVARIRSYVEALRATGVPTHAEGHEGDRFYTEGREQILLARLVTQRDEAIRLRGPMCPEPGCGLSCAYCDRKQLREALEWIEANESEGKALVKRAFAGTKDLP